MYLIVKRYRAKYHLFLPIIYLPHTLSRFSVKRLYPPNIAVFREAVFYLQVSAASAPGGFSIIDQDGCTTETGLFEHVEYESELVAGIRNPYPIRFRGAASTVRFNCATRFAFTFGVVLGKF